MAFVPCSVPFTFVLILLSLELSSGESNQKVSEPKKDVVSKEEITQEDGEVASSPHSSHQHESTPPKKVIRMYL